MTNEIHTIIPSTAKSDAFSD